jgi:hypothetical protein
MYRTQYIWVALLFLITWTAGPLVAQEDGGSLFDINEDDLFGSPDDDSSGSDLEDDLFGGSDDDLFSDDMIEDNQDASTAGFNDLLTSDVPSIGGRFSFSTNTRFDPENLEDLDDVSSTYSLGSTLTLDARPDPDFRVFLKSSLGYTTGGSGPSATASLEELFADVTMADWLYLRGGKQNMSWGVGYFFSPADFLSLEGIDPDDPEAEREGPVAVKLQTPINTTNIYAYAILEDLPTENRVSWAAKVDLVAGNSEFQIGAAYQRDNFFGSMVTWSGSVGDFDLFAEGVIRRGSLITIVEGESPALTLNEREDEWFPVATAGGRYSWSDDDGLFSISLLGQYFFNSEGYEDPDILKDPLVFVLLATDNEFTTNDLIGTGRHYAATSFSWNGAFDSDFSPSAFWLGNLSDGSGFVSTSIRYRINDNMSLSPGYTYTYGDDGDEYAPFGAGHSVSLSLGLGSGSF